MSCVVRREGDSQGIVSGDESVPRTVNDVVSVVEPTAAIIVLPNKQKGRVDEILSAAELASGNYKEWN